MVKSSWDTEDDEQSLNYCMGMHMQERANAKPFDTMESYSDLYNESDMSSVPPMPSIDLSEDDDVELMYPESIGSPDGQLPRTSQADSSTAIYTTSSDEPLSKKRVKGSKSQSKCTNCILLVVAVAIVFLAAAGFAVYATLLYYNEAETTATAPEPLSPVSVTTSAPVPLPTSSPTSFLTFTATIPTGSPNGTMNPTQPPSTLAPTASTPAIDYTTPIRLHLESLGVQFDSTIDAAASIRSKALDWLVSDMQESEPEEQGEVNTLKNDYPRLVQRFALFVLGLSLDHSPQTAISRFGSYEEDFFFERWNKGPLNKNECYWPGITCGGDLQTTEITSINVGRMNLDGSVPSEIALLTSLTYLDLAQNFIQGTIPEELLAITSLKKVFMYKNQFMGSIPSTISNSITHLHLSHNHLGGPFPEIVQPEDGLGGLRFLNLYKNQISGSIPETLQLPFLDFLDVGYNQLIGNLPDSLPDSSPYLEHLHLDHNRFTGPLPESYVSSTNERMLALTLDYNELTGEIPAGGDPTLIEYTLQKNAFSKLAAKTCKMDLFAQKGWSVIEFDADCDICLCSGGSFCSSCNTVEV